MSLGHVECWACLHHQNFTFIVQVVLKCFDAARTVLDLHEKVVLVCELKLRLRFWRDFNQPVESTCQEVIDIVVVSQAKHELDEIAH